METSMQRGGSEAEILNNVRFRELERVKMIRGLGKRKELRSKGAEMCMYI